MVRSNLQCMKCMKQEEDNRLKRILLNLSHYECDKLVQQSLAILVQMHSFEDDLFSFAGNCQLIENDLIHENYTKIGEVLPSIHHLFKISHNKYEKTRGLIDKLTEICLSGDEKPHQENQKLLYNHGINTSIIIIGILIYYTHLIHTGILSDVLSFVLTKPEIDTNETNDEERKEVFKSCFRLLQTLAYNNPVVNSL